MKKKTMYFVRKNHINEEPVPATVYYNENDGSIDHFYDPEEDCYYTDQTFVKFFETKEDAEAFQHDFKFYLLSKMPEVKEYLQMMEDFSVDDESSEFYHKETDYLYRSSDFVSSWMKSCLEERALCSKYKKLAVKGVISLQDRSIQYSEVEQAYNEDNNIILRLKSLNGEVSVTNKVDKEFVCEIFGL